MTSNNTETVSGGELCIRVPYSFRRVSGRKRIVQTKKPTDIKKSVYMKFLRAIAEGIKWRSLLVKGVYYTLNDLSVDVRTDPRYVRRKIALACLSPGIINLLLQCAENPEKGTFPNITLSKLMEIALLPWPEQHKQLGIA